MRGKWEFRKGLYREKYQEALRLRARFTDLRFRWIPREENKEADELSRGLERESSLDHGASSAGFLEVGERGPVGFGLELVQIP